MEKKLPEKLADILKKQSVKGRKIRLMFQDEARFGRMARIRRCWAPAGTRPEVLNGYVREFTHAYGAVSPNEGTLDWMLCQKMNTQHMGEFLSQVGKAHADEFVVMVVDGASSHVAKALEIPENVRLLKLPAYSPQLNPQENIWDEMREKYFPNRVFSDMAKVRRQLQAGFGELAADQARLHSITAWPWIKNIILKET